MSEGDHGSLGQILRGAIIKSELWGDKSHDSGSHLVRIKCPECGRYEAWAYSAKPFAVICNHHRSCGAQTRTLDIFPELVTNVERDFKPTAKDPHRPATQYLFLRGLSRAIERLRAGDDYIHVNNIRKSGCGGVLFLVVKSGDGKGIWNGRIYSPPPDEDKSHNVGAVAGKVWKHPGIVYDAGKPTYVTEAIIEALSLIEIGLQAVSVLSAGSNPKGIDLGDLAENLVLAFNGDSAGASAFKKWKKVYPDAAIAAPDRGDWNDLLQSMGYDGFKSHFTEKREELRFNADLLLSPNGYDYANKWYQYHGNCPGIFVFDKCYWYSYLKTGKNESVVAYEIGNFTCRVKNYEIEYSVREEPVYRYRLEIMPQSGGRETVIFTSEDMSSPRSMRTAFLKRGKVIWKGADRATADLAEMIVKTKEAVVRRLTLLGHDEETELYCFDAFAVNKLGTLVEPNKDGIIKVTYKGYVRPPTEACLKPHGGVDVANIFKLINLAWPDNGALGVTFLVASWFVCKVKRELGFFPFLSLWGETQTGKSTLMKKLNALQCLEEEGMPLSRLNTSKGEIRRLAQRSSLAIGMLESNSDEASRFEFETLLTLYNYGNSLQTRAVKSNDNQTVDMFFLATLIFVQNREPFKTRAQKERVISSREFKIAHITPESSEAFNLLLRIPTRKLASFFIEVMKHRGVIEGQWQEEYEKARNELLGHLNDNRICENHGIILAFYRILDRIFGIGYDMLPFILELAGNKAHQCMHRQSTPADAFFEGLDSLPEEKQLRVIMAKDDMMFVKMTEALKVLGDSGYKYPPMSYLYQDLREHPAFINSNKSLRCSFGEAVQRVHKVWQFDIAKL